jgi:hypothetical protein
MAEEVELECAVYSEGTVFSVTIARDAKVEALREAIFEKKRYSERYTFASSDLTLYLARKKEGGESKWLKDDRQVKDFLRGGISTEYEEMRPSWPLNDEDYFGGNFQPGSKEIHVLVELPSDAMASSPDVGSKRAAGDAVGEVMKRLKILESDADATTNKPQTLTDFEDLVVSEDEFQLDSLATVRASGNPIVMTPILHEFWKGFGDFPLFYFVRTEEVVFWQVIKKLLLGEDRVVIIGSPGVGKSCFLMLIAFYLACIKKRKVLVIRRLKQRKQVNAVVFFDGLGSYGRLSNLSSQDIKAIRGQAQGAIVLVDGFNQEEVKDPDKNYLPFDFLATSCQFDAKNDDNSRIVVLPAWRDADLLEYARLTNWVIETGLRKIKRCNTPFAKLVKEQYFYSGGSLREFCRSREMLVIRVARDCGAVDNAQAFELVYNYGGGQSMKQVDRLRRHYITNPCKQEHYYDSRYWKLSVDSGYVLSKLGRVVDTAKQLQIYTYAESVGAGFHGVAYELLLHNAVRGAFVKSKPVALKMREGSVYEKIEIRVPNVVCSGEDEASCYPCLSTLDKGTYWYPDYPFFPFIDAVTTCEAFPIGSEVPETIVAYIQVTIRSEKKFKKERLALLNEEMNKNSSLKDMKRAFVIVGPDSGVCERFTLHDAPDPNAFLTMVSCFDPEQLEPKAS